MKKIRFGRTDLQVSRLCFGGVSFGVSDPGRGWDPYTPQGRKQSLHLLRTARDLGVNLFDTWLFCCSPRRQLACRAGVVQPAGREQHLG